MKQLNTLLLLLIALVGTVSLSAQAGRYRTKVFTGFSVQRNVTYASNITVLRNPTIAPEDLKMDIYTPAGDTETSRPVVIYFHTGSFLPPLINGGITGARNDSSCVEFARRLTGLGYVVCVTSYRLGWNPAATGPAGHAPQPFAPWPGPRFDDLGPTARPAPMPHGRPPPSCE